MAVNHDVISYIQQKGWPVRSREKWDIVGWQMILDCPLCNKKSDGEQRRFYISESTGQWKTFCCQQDGNLITLQRKLGDLDVRLVSAGGVLDSGAKGFGQKLLASRSGAAAMSLVTEKHTLPKQGLDVEYHAALLGCPEALAYLREERGFTDATIERARYGFRAMDAAQATKAGIPEGTPGHGWIAIPWYLPDGTLAGFKYRAMKATEAALNTRFRREKGSPTVLYGAQRLASKPASVVTLYEGEFDADSGDQIGFPFGLASTGGAGTWQPEWTVLLAGVDTILLAYDDDPAGDAGAEKVAEALGRWRCRRIRLPRHDANACIAPATACPLEEVLSAMIQAEPFRLLSMKSAGDYTGILDLDRGKAMGIDPSVPGLMAILGGLRGAEITLITGETGQGKTTFTTFWAWSLATAGFGPVMVSSPEIVPEEEVLKLATMEAGAPFLDLDKPGRLYILQRLNRKGIIVYNGYGKQTKASLFDSLRYLYRACGGRFAVVDHLQFFVGRAPGQQGNDAIDEFLMELNSLLVNECPGLHVVLVAHPSNQGASDRDKKTGARRVSMFDIKGSSGARQLVSNVAVIERAERLDGKLRAYLRFEKVRSLFGATGEVAFEFDKDALHYKSLHAVAAAQAQAQTAAPAPTAIPALAAPPPRKPKDRKKLAAGDREESENDE